MQIRLGYFWNEITTGPDCVDTGLCGATNRFRDRVRRAAAQNTDRVEITEQHGARQQSSGAREIVPMIHVERVRATVAKIRDDVVRIPANAQDLRGFKLREKTRKVRFHERSKFLWPNHLGRSPHLVDRQKIRARDAIKRAHAREKIGQDLKPRRDPFRSLQRRQPRVRVEKLPGERERTGYPRADRDFLADSVVQSAQRVRDEWDAARARNVTWNGVGKFAEGYVYHGWHEDIEVALKIHVTAQRLGFDAEIEWNDRGLETAHLECARRGGSHLCPIGMCLAIANTNGAETRIGQTR